jgi:hypothetical protein
MHRVPDFEVRLETMQPHLSRYSAREAEEDETVPSVPLLGMANP